MELSSALLFMPKDLRASESRKAMGDSVKEVVRR